MIELFPDSWEQLIERVERLNPNSEFVLKERLHIRPKSVKRHEGKKTHTTYVDLDPLDGHEVKLMIYEGKMDKAIYALFDNSLNRVYVRDVL